MADQDLRRPITEQGRMAMSEYEVFDPATEVIGEGIAAFAAGFPGEVREMGWKILEKYQIHNVLSGKFYPLQSYLDAMKEIASKFGGGMLVRIGEQIASTAVIPPSIDSLDLLLTMSDQAYAMNHRGGEVGHWVYTNLGTVHGLRTTQIECNTPYPCQFDRGVLEGFAKRFRPAGVKDVIVRHDDLLPCRRSGGTSCTFIISWG
jgi:hypothetical protein